MQLTMQLPRPRGPLRRRLIGFNAGLKELHNVDPIIRISQLNVCANGKGKFRGKMLGENSENRRKRRCPHHEKFMTRAE